MFFVSNFISDIVFPIAPTVNSSQFFSFSTISVVLTSFVLASDVLFSEDPHDIKIVTDRISAIFFILFIFFLVINY